VFLAAACGLAAFATRHSRAAFLVLLPCLGLGAASLWAGNRFLMFLAPLFGIGLAWLCLDLLLPLLHRRGAPGPTVLCVLAGALLAAPAAWDCLALNIRPNNDRNGVELASVINHKASANAFVWNWWGPGYMQEYFTRRECLIDGGLQEPQRTYISAVPFATADPLLARNWIKFFSVHSDGLDVLARLTGGPGRAATLLQAVFSAPARMPELLDSFGLPRDRDWRAYLFPERDVYLILMAGMLLRSTWNSLGRWDPATGQSPDVRVYLTPEKDVRINRAQGVVVSRTGDAVAYSRLYVISPDNLSYDQVRDTGPVALRILGAPYLYTVAQEYFDCMAYRLLFVYPDKTPGFEPVVYNPFVGGVWKVR